jgi:TPR repeat protein
MIRKIIPFSSRIQNVVQFPTTAIIGTITMSSHTNATNFDKYFINNFDQYLLIRRLTNTTGYFHVRFLNIRFLSNVSSSIPSNNTTTATMETTGIDANIDTTTNSVDTTTNDGEKMYQQYLITLEELNQFKEKQERIKSEKLFEAWKRTQQPESNNENIDSNTSSKGTTTDTSTSTSSNNKNKNAGGVAVVRTLARETNKNRENDPIDVLQKRAKNQLQISAIKYKYPTALVQLANTELQSLSEQTKNGEWVSVPFAKEKIDTCLQYYHIAGEAGDAAAYYNLGHLYWDGIDDIIKADQDEALQYFYKAIHLGDTDAMFFVGVFRLGHPKEYRHDQIEKALLWIEQAANHGHGGALHYLTVFHMNGYKPLNMQPCSDDEFQRLMAAAIPHDETGEAYYLRGSCYYSGTYGYPKDILSCFNDFVSAAELGHSDGCINAGVILHKGVPGKIDQDQSRAFQYYQRAGELGNVEGWRNVVSCYLTGQGVKQSEETAKYIAETMLRPLDENNDKSKEQVEDRHERIENNDK